MSQSIDLHGWGTKDWEYPDPICMICGKKCYITEEVSTSPTGYGYWELWCYCKACKIDTFHPRRPIKDSEER